MGYVGEKGTPGELGAAFPGPKGDRGDGGFPGRPGEGCQPGERGCVQCPAGSPGDQVQDAYVAL